jgi:hypothetical protein
MSGESSQMPEQLLASYEAFKSTRVENPVGQESFDADSWLGSFYEYYYDKQSYTNGDQKDGLKEAAVDVLGEIPDLDNDFREALKASLVPKERRLGIAKKVDYYIGKSRFEDLLATLARKREASQLVAPLDSEVGYGTKVAVYHLEAYDSQAKTLSEDVLAQKDEISSLKITREIAENQVINHLLQSGEKGVSQLLENFLLAKQDLGNSLDRYSPSQLIGLLLTHRGLLEKLDGSERLNNLYVNLNVLPTLSRGGLSRILEKADIKALFTDDSWRNAAFTDLINRQVIAKDSRELLIETIPTMSCCLRTLSLEKLVDNFNLGDKEQRILYASSLIDLVRDGVSAVLVEDIVEGRIKGNDLVGTMMVDWLLEEGLQDQGKIPLDNLNIENAKLAEIIDLIKNGVAGTVKAAMLPLIASMSVLTKITEFLPIEQLLKFQGGSRSVLRSPFEGMEGFSNKILWKNDIHEYRTPLLRRDFEGIVYIREQSSSTFNFSTLSWEDDNQSVGFKESQRSAIEDRLTGGGLSTSRESFTYLPVPYSLFPEEGAIVRTDGSCGFEPSPSPRKIKEIKFKRDDRLDRYPFDVDKALTPIIHSPDELPQGVRNFLISLDRKRLGKREEAEEIIAYINENFIYSIDTKNEEIYKNALGQGEVAFFNKIFDLKKVKCDGAATIAIALLRLRNIPSRIAMGYAPDIDSKYIRSKDAHAWVEVLISDKLFVGDPTPDIMDDDALKKSLVASYLESMSSFIFRKTSKWEKEREFDRYIDYNREYYIRRMLSEIISSDDSRLDIYLSSIYLRHFDRKPDRTHKQYISLWPKAKQDRESLQAINKKVREEGISSLNDLLRLFDEAGIISEKAVRAEILANNFIKTVEPIVTDFFGKIYGEFLFSQEFVKKYPDLNYPSTSYLNFYSMSSLLIAEENKNPLINIKNPDGSYSEEFLQRIVRSLQAVIRHAGLDDFTLGRKKVVDPKDLEEERLRILPKITVDLVKDCFIPDAANSFIQAYRVINS